MNAARSHAMCEYTNYNYLNKIYIFGGRNDTNGYANSVESYDIESNTWNLLNNSHQLLSIARSVGDSFVYTINTYLLLVVLMHHLQYQPLIYLMS